MEPPERYRRRRSSFRLDPNPPYQTRTSSWKTVILQTVTHRLERATSSQADGYDTERMQLTLLGYIIAVADAVPDILQLRHTMRRRSINGLSYTTQCAWPWS